MFYLSYLAFWGVQMFFNAVLLPYVSIEDEEAHLKHQRSAALRIHYNL